ncbi:MAG: NAD-dependent epimerase/dehydratase family protein [Sphingobacteriaceae bacterium]|nr:MAG: NAD-dependent epimerase/dehydratase family protein [Sphingobacteriaceae bacterium]
MELKIIITGATGMVGEGVLLECLAHPAIKQVVSVARKPSGRRHPKLEEILVSNFLALDEVKTQLSGFDACFYCAGVSAVGMKEAEYTRMTYDLTLHFAETLAKLNPGITFCYISGQGTDSSEKGKQMWARVKGRTENTLMRLPLKKAYNFRPGLMKPTPGQKNIKMFFKVLSALYPLFHLLFPNSTSTMKEVGLAMIGSVKNGYSKQILEVKDIKILAKTA